ncbi:MAG: ABC transporter ATP-binding protein [Planctomycetota bacterium]|jgi:iron complex transport system ATP-binding protein|nr:ABC transporter ATP-binding protein [Planctomycetota bacterium]
MSLSATGLEMRYGPCAVLRGIDLSLQPGRLTALCGPNGTGKTTLLKGLLGLMAPSAGAVSVDGRSLTSLSQLERAATLAYVPQRSALSFDLRVREVVSQGRYPHRGAWQRMRGEDHAAIDAAMADCDLTAMAGRHFLSLSVGEQQRVLLARALATGAPWLLVDEPTAALDIGHALDVLARLQRLAASGTGVVCVLHRIDEIIRFADHAVLLHHGGVASEGDPAQVFTPERVAAIYGVRMEANTAPAFYLGDEA